MKTAAEIIINQPPDFYLNFFEIDLVLEILYLNEDLNESFVPAVQE